MTSELDAVVATGTVDGVSGSAVASVIVAVLTLPVPWAVALASSRTRVESTDWERIEDVYLRDGYKLRLERPERTMACEREKSVILLVDARPERVAQRGRCRGSRSGEVRWDVASDERRGKKECACGLPLYRPSRNFHHQL